MKRGTENMTAQVQNIAAKIEETNQTIGKMTASIQELNGMMQTVDQNSGELGVKIEELIHELTKFTI